jgi:hypothetical protein
MELHGLESARVQSEEQSNRGEVDALSERVLWLHTNPPRLHRNLPAKRLPTEVWSVHQVSAGVKRVTEEVGTLVAGIGIPTQGRWEGVEGG